MVILNYTDGRAQSFDLSDPEEERALREIGRDPNKHGVRAVWMKTEHDCWTLPMPRRYRRVFFVGEVVSHRKTGMPIGERLTVMADETELVIDVQYSGPNSEKTRVAMFKQGRPRFRPN